MSFGRIKVRVRKTEREFSFSFNDRDEFMIALAKVYAREPNIEVLDHFWGYALSMTSEEVARFLDSEINRNKWLCD